MCAGGIRREAVGDDIMRRYLGVLLVIIGLVLFLDQLYLFGIPFGGFLGDLSAYDPTSSPWIHHWMLGLVLIAGGIILCR